MYLCALLIFSIILTSTICSIITQKHSLLFSPVYFTFQYKYIENKQ